MEYSVSELVSEQPSQLLALVSESVKFGAAAMEAIARQPESAGDIRSNMIVIAALVEGVALFAVIVCVLSLFL